MSVRRAMSLLEILIATAMLAMIASALIGFGGPVLPDINALEGNLDADLTGRLTELRRTDPALLEEQLQLGEQITRIGSVSPESDQLVLGEWVIAETEHGVVVRWNPLPNESAELIGDRP